MLSRRQVLGGVVAGAAGSLAGCSPCGETWFAYSLTLDVTEIAEAGSALEYEVAATADFEFPTEPTHGVGAFEIAAYGPDLTVLDTARVDGLRWRDAPEERRIETDCGDSGSATATRTLTVSSVPQYVGPRFIDGRTVGDFEPGRNAGFTAIVAATLADADGSPTNDGGNGGSSTTDGGDGGSPRSTPEPSQYEPTAVDALPWPEPDNQAVTETAAFTDVAFFTRSECATRGEPFVSVRGRSDVGVRWARPIPADSCERPYLQDLTADGDAVTVTVGLHDAPHVLWRDCDHIGYSLSANHRSQGGDPVGDAFSEVVLVHVSTDGEIEERIVVPID